MYQPPSLKVIYCLICDDVRLEVGFKESLIGVYTTGISVPALPWRGSACVWMSVIWSGEGALDLDVRLVDPKFVPIGTTRGRARAIQHGRESSLSFRNLLFEINTEGTHIVQWCADGSDWETIKSFPVGLTRT